MAESPLPLALAPFVIPLGISALPISIFLVIAMVLKVLNLKYNLIRLKISKCTQANKLLMEVIKTVQISWQTEIAQKNIVQNLSTKLLCNENVNITAKTTFYCHNLRAKLHKM